MKKEVKLNSLENGIRNLVVSNISIEESIELFDKLIKEKSEQHFTNVVGETGTLEDATSFVVKDDVDSKQSKIEQYLKLIYKVEKIYDVVHGDGYRVYHRINGNNIYEVYEDCYYRKVKNLYSNSEVKLMSLRGKDRYTIWIPTGTSISTERLFKIWDAIITDSVPCNLSKLCVNVMDMTGNLKTCKKYGWKMDLSLANLEWTEPEKNIIHAKIVKFIWEELGLHVRLSANNNVALALYRCIDMTKDNTKALALFKHYCENYLYIVA